MMNVLIFEYITGGGLVGEALSNALVKEGELMVNAVAHDFAKIPNIKVNVLRDYRLQNTAHLFDEHIVSTEKSYADIIDGLEEKIDFMLIVAPETDNILTELCKKYSQYNFLLLNSSNEAISLTGNKLMTYQYLNKCKIPQVPSYEIDDHALIQFAKVLVKPKDGVGCENMRLLKADDNIEDYISHSELDNYFAQPYLSGESMSLSLICWQGECLLLSVNKQLIKENGKSLKLEGCVTNAYDRSAYIDFSEKLVANFPELKGYIGVDVFVTDDEAMLLEINPRLTTSYVGLSSALGVNPAELILYTFKHQRLPNISLPAGQSVMVDASAEYAA